MQFHKVRQVRESRAQNMFALPNGDYAIALVFDTDTKVQDTSLQLSTATARQLIEQLENALASPPLGGSSA